MTDYLALVHRGTKAFDKVFAPGSEILVEDAGVVTLASFVGDSSCLQWRVWIPPGTKCLQATMYVYHEDTAGKVLMRMGKPPVGGLDSVTPENAAAVDLRNVLASLLAGAEVPCYTPAKGGFIKLSDGSMDSPVVATTWGWLYIKALQMPGKRVAQLDVRVTADAALYHEWYDSAMWDEQGNPLPGQIDLPPVESHEDRVIRLLDEAELIEPLMALAGAKTDIELGKKALATGVWAGLLRLIK